LPAPSRDPVAVAPPPSGPRTERWDGEIFTCSVTLVCAGRPLTPFADVVTELDDLGRRFSRFDPDSELSRFNASSGRWHDVSHRLHRLLRAALEAASASGGLFNVAVLAALARAGYETSWPVPTLPSTPTLGEPVVPLPEAIELRPGQARLRPGTAVDLGGLAKGLWADELVDHLGSNAVVSLGGDLACRGGSPETDGEGWPVEVTGGQRFLVRNAGVATSGVGRRTWGPGRHHLIDPRTGLPSASDVRTASVLAPSAADAEWMATSVVIGGTDVAAQLMDCRRPRVEVTLERTEADDRDHDHDVDRAAG
jgi:FAD:protein FMN transferase